MKTSVEIKLIPWEKEISKSNEDNILELLSEITVILIDHHDLTTFLLREGPIHYMSNQLGLGNFAEAELYLRLSNSWFSTFLSRSNKPDKAQLFNDAYRQFVERLKLLFES